MDMITADEVIRRMELYFTGGAIKFLGTAQWRVAKQGMENFDLAYRSDSTAARQLQTIGV